MKILDASKLDALAEALVRHGYRVVAPGLDGDVLRLKEWRPGQRIEAQGIPVNSAKDFLFPRSEIIGRYTLDGDAFQVEEVAPKAPKTVLVGVRPCDAVGLGVLDAVFNWDYKDSFYNARRDATTLVTLACTEADAACFCTSVGGAPDGTAGADAVLRPADGGSKFILEPLSAKGEALLVAGETALADGEARADPPADVPVRFDAEAVCRWCAEKDHFESPLWREASLACLGCGACAYMCPTCHCFDIQDEATRAESLRYRNWDSCGFGLFTLHAGGHNPRPSQTSRWRQRVMHKFRYFLDRFDRLACSGCGRCVRLCPGGMSIAEVCQRIDEACEALKK